jgi:hypothetical protein
MDTNAVYCLGAGGIVVLLAVLVWLYRKAMANREKKATQARIEGRRVWSKEYHDQQENVEPGEEKK